MVIGPVVRWTWIGGPSARRLGASAAARPAISSSPRPIAPSDGRPGKKLGAPAPSPRLWSAVPWHRFLRKAAASRRTPKAGAPAAKLAALRCFLGLRRRGLVEERQRL